MAEKRRSLKNIKESALSRGFALAKVSVSMGARAAGHAVSSWVGSEADQEARTNSMLRDQVTLLVRELGQLKGSVMKVGQMLSMVGEQFLPPEINSVLKTLQSQSPPLEWPAIEKVLKRQLGEEKLGLLEIDPEPFASASLGQVHRARVKADGTELALKIQYPGVDNAIDGDLKSLRSILSKSKLIPKGPKYDELFAEVRMMLHQEVDYSRELTLTDEFREAFKDDPRYIVPRTFPEFSTKRVIATSFELGVAVDGPEVRALPTARRNAIGESIVDLFLIELFKLNKSQSDPHFGNYKIRLGEPGEPDRIVLLDFGAVRKFPKNFMVPYRRFVSAIMDGDSGALISAATELEYLLPADSEEVRRNFSEFCFLIMESCLQPGHPRTGARELYDDLGRYIWSKSDLPKRVTLEAPRLALNMKLRPPPRETVFLDRKMSGIFFFLSALDVRIDMEKLVRNSVFGS